MERPAYIISDLHLSQGQDAKTGTWHVLEDFKADSALCAFLDHISAANEPVELVIAGDFIEYLQILPHYGPMSPVDHLGTTEAQSLERTLVVLGQRPDIASGHPEVFQRLRRFMQDGHSITILAGNHDIDLLWSSVWATLASAICPPDASGTLRLEPFHHTLGTGEQGRVYVQHGHEHDRANAFGNQMQKPFGVDDQDVKRLKRCWGTLFVDTVYNMLEQEYWFIDSVKPILRMVKLGLQGDLSFTKEALVLIGKFYLTKGIPQLGVSFSVPGAPGSEVPPEQRTVESVLQTVDDGELRALMQQRLQDDPTLRAEFEQQMQQFSPTEQQAMQEMQAEIDAMSPSEADMPSFGLGLGMFESAYRKAARMVMEADSSIATVVMGHTHHPIDGTKDPLDLRDGRTGYFFNSGTWTPHLVEREEEYTWEELRNAANYEASLDYLHCIPQREGGYQVVLKSWHKESGMA